MKSYAQQKDPARSAAGIGIVVLLHIILIWALINGLGHKMIDVIKGPLETKIVTPPKPKQQETPPPPPPQVVTPPPPYIPPPVVNVQTPVSNNAISAVTNTPPPVQQVIRPAPPPAPPRDVDVSERPISNAQPVYPPSLIDDEIEGTADVECDVDTTGHTSNCKIDSVTGSSLFGASALAYAESNVYSPATHNGVPVTAHRRWHLNFKLTDAQ